MGRRVSSCRVVSVFVPPCYPHIEPIFISSLSLSLLRLEYAKVNNTKHGLPTDEMPKFKYLEDDGRADLKRGEVVMEVDVHSYAYMLILDHMLSYHMLISHAIAISKFGGKKNISHKAGLTVT